MADRNDYRLTATIDHDDQPRPAPLAPALHKDYALAPHGDQRPALDQTSTRVARQLTLGVAQK